MDITSRVVLGKAYEDLVIKWMHRNADVVEKHCKMFVVCCFGVWCFCGKVTLDEPRVGNDQIVDQTAISRCDK